MLKKIEKRILDFAKNTGLTDRRELVHGTLYVKLHEEKECDTFHRVIRTFYKDQINNEGSVEALRRFCERGRQVLYPCSKMAAFGR